MRFAGDALDAYTDPRKLNFANQFAQHNYNQGTIDNAEMMGDYAIKSAENQGELAIMKADAQGQLGQMQQDAKNQAGMTNAFGGLVEGFVAPALGKAFGPTSAGGGIFSFLGK